MKPNKRRAMRVKAREGLVRYASEQGLVQGAIARGPASAKLVPTPLEAFRLGFVGSFQLVGDAARALKVVGKDFINRDAITGQFVKQRRR